MGGRAAEELILQHLTTGAGNDIERSTELARKMVCNWGMSEFLGPLAFGKRDEHIFLGREISQNRDFSEETARLIDSEIKKFVEESYLRARSLLLQYEAGLHALALALLEKETLTSDEVDAIVAQHTAGNLSSPADIPGPTVSPAINA
jgi:cell division protease FtsH